MSRQGDWIQTYTGKKFYPLDPREDEIDINDIAHALSLQCRYGGHCREFYSVAQHSVLVSMECPIVDSLWGLLHDAPEAYIIDVPRPIKPFLVGYKEMEHRLMECICRKYGLPLEEPKSVKMADKRLLVTEVNHLMQPVHPEWEGGLQGDLSIQPLENWESVVPWPSFQAEDRFLSLFRYLITRETFIRGSYDY